MMRRSNREGSSHRLSRDGINVSNRDPLICRNYRPRLKRVCGHHMGSSRIRFDGKSNADCSVRCNACKAIHDVYIRFPSDSKSRKKT